MISKIVLVPTVAALALSLLPGSAVAAGPQPASTSEEPAQVEQQLPNAAPVKPEVDVVDLERDAEPAEPEVTPDPEPDSADPSAEPEPTSEPSQGDGSEDTADQVPDDEATAEEPAEDEPADDEPSPEEEPALDDPAVRASSLIHSEVVIVGVTWQGDAEDVEVVELRTRQGETWSDWEPMEISSLEADAPAQESEGTEPVALLEADEVEVQLLATGEDVLTPELSIWDPGVSAADDDAEATSSGASGSGGRALPAALTARPSIYSRADWGADESLMRWTPQLGRVTGVVVHHTAGQNGYSASQVPAIIRGIYAYHAVTRNWGDIGYNVLVDRFGRAWEGRAGGLEKAITGAHAAGYNSNMFGISVMGNYEVTEVPEVAMDTVARVTAWKFGLHGVSASGTTYVNGRTLKAVTGHRDVADTVCPGRYFYPRLGELTSRIEAYAGSSFGGGSPELDRDLNEDGGVADLLSVSAGQLGLATGPDATFDPGWQISGGWKGRQIVTPGDWDGDGTDDILFTDDNGQLRLIRGTAGGGFRKSILMDASTGWGPWQLIGGGIDWNGDGKADLIGQHANGDLRLWNGNGKGGIKSRKFLARGEWDTRDQLTLVPRFIGNQPALVARERATGVLYAYPPAADLTPDTGKRVRIGAGWAKMTHILGVRDFDGDAVGNIMARQKDGRVWMFSGKGNGRLHTKYQIGEEWPASWRLFSAGRSQRFGQDILAIDLAGKLHRHSNPGPRIVEQVAPGVQTGSGAIAVSPGDFTGNDRSDVLVQRSDGRLMLHEGRDGGFADPVQVGTGWYFSQLVSAGDWDGNGTADLIAYEGKGGTVWFYPGTGAGGFGYRVPVAPKLGNGNYDLIGPAGDWDGDGVPDLFARGASSGSLYLVPGRGAGLLTEPVKHSSGWGSYASILGVDDADGDKKLDIIGVRPNGVAVFHRGMGNGNIRYSTVIRKTPASFTRVN